MARLDPTDWYFCEKKNWDVFSGKTEEDSGNDGHFFYFNQAYMPLKKATISKPRVEPSLSD